METTEQNLKIITEKLKRFRHWNGFPKEKEDVLMRTRLLCKLVRNKTCREIFGQDQHELGADTNDLDWLLDSIAETLEVFPMHAAMRRMYTEYFPTDNERMINHIRTVANGDVW